MSLYGSVGDGVATSKAFLHHWHSIALENASAIPENGNAADLQQRQILIIKANQELAFANDILNQIIKNIRDLQP